VVARRAFDCDIRETSPQPGDEMHSLVRWIDRHLVSQPMTQSGDEDVALVLVLQAHPTQMGREMSLLDEVRNHRLGQA
jgi:phosphoenolpyruvate carboxylase